MNLSIPIAIGVGGFVGALARYYVSGAVVRAAGEDYSFAGTLTVNLIGCFVIGILTAVAARSDSFSDVMQKCLITGLLGSLTTFSTFGLDSLNLLKDGRVGAAVTNVGVNVAAGLLLVWIGMITADRFFPGSETDPARNTPEQQTDR